MDGGPPLDLAPAAVSPLNLPFDFLTVVVGELTELPPESTCFKSQHLNPKDIIKNFFLVPNNLLANSTLIS